MKFLRRSHDRYSKLGLRRKKKQIWRKPTGRDNKMREKRRGYSAVVSIGYRSEENSRGTLKEKQPVMVNNLNDLKKLRESQIAVIGKIGKKKKLEIANKAKELKIEIYNMNPEKYLTKNEKKVEDKKTETNKEEKK